MKKLNNYLLCLLLIGLLAGCSEEDENVDNTSPTVSNITLNEQHEAIIVEAGSEMHFEAVFEDNIKLGQYKIDIHSNFDGHDHGRIKAPFTFSQSYELTGKSETVQQQIAIPEGSTPGEYHFELQYFDAVGNEGEIAVLEFEVIESSN